MIRGSFTRTCLWVSLLVVVSVPTVAQVGTNITIGSTVSGSLTTASALSTRRQGSYAAYYFFQGTAGQTVSVSLTSAQFDTYLYLVGPSGAVVAENDDSGTSSNSRIPPGSGMLALPATGLYTIEATSFATNTFGEFVVALDGQCVTPPRAVVRFDTLDYVTDPDANGVRLLVGQMSAERLQQIGAGIQNLPLPVFPNQRFCGAIDVAPGVRVEVFVPTADERLGDYSRAGPVLWDPATRRTLADGTEVMDPFPNSIVPQSRLQPGGLFAWRLASLLPSVPGVLPPSPGAGNAASQTFAFQFTAANGYQDLGVLNILVNNFLDGRRACYLAYAQPLKILYLVNDPGDALLPYFELKGTGSVGNSQCTIYGVGSSVTGSGNTLTLTLNMSFSPSFAGDKVFYVAARDRLENNSGWQALGTWSVPSAATTSPRVTGMTPGRGSGGSGQVSFQFSDNKGWQNLGVVNMLLNNFLDGRYACYMAYARTINVLYLVNDAGNALLPGLVVNGTGTIGNSQCTITNSTVSGSGNVMTVTMGISFGAGFAGNRVFYLAARDVNELNNTGWQAMGSWTVQ